jgi:chorismate mutase
VQAINTRLKLVAQLKAYKEQHHMEFYDPERDQWMLTFVTRANRGPLSAEGLRDIFLHMLAVTRRELGAEDAVPRGLSPKD